MTDTGFFSGDNGNQQCRNFGKWFRLDYGVLPDFLSQRTFQHSVNAVNSGWKIKKTHYPDLWINPEDSFVLTINAGEITKSTDFSAGVCLRFPRISKIRAKDFDDGPKPAEEVESVNDLHNLFQQRQYQQQEAERESQAHNQYMFDYDENVAENKFKSMDQSLKKISNRKKRPRPELNVLLPNIEGNHTIISNSLSRYLFMVLDGHYELACDDPLDELQAKSEGWYDLAHAVKSQQDVINFILKHGGEIGNEDCDFIVGGSYDDARVVNYRRAIDRVTESNLSGKTNSDKNLCKMVKSGVVKWTFFFAKVHKNCQDGNASKVRINDLCPRKYDYLVMSKFAEGRLEEVEDCYGINLTEDSTLFELKRALNEVKKQCDNGYELFAQKRLKQNYTDAALENPKSWQYEINNLFTTEEKVRNSLMSN